MRRDGETGSIKRVTGVPYPEGAADSEAHREDPTKTDLLLACPEKGWFVPVPSESTADLDGPGFEEPHDQIPR